MSHIAQIEIEVRDLDCLEAACKELGLDVARGQTKYKWWGSRVGREPLPAGFHEADLGHCEHAIKIPGNEKAYEIGICQRRDGKPGFTLLWDFFNGGYGLQEKVGQNAGKLTQLYAVHVATKQAKQQGYAVQRKVLQDGKIQLACRR